MTPCPRCLSIGPCMLGCGHIDWDAPTYVNMAKLRSRARKFAPAKVRAVHGNPNPHYSTRVNALARMSVPSATVLT